MSEEHNTFQQSSPTCPHCGYALDTDDMLSDFSDADLFAIAPNDESADVTCPQCDKEYAVQGGYRPHYTSAFSHEEL